MGIFLEKKETKNNSSVAIGFDWKNSIKKQTKINKYRHRQIITNQSIDLKSN